MIQAASTASSGEARTTPSPKPYPGWRKSWISALNRQLRRVGLMPNDNSSGWCGPDNEAKLSKSENEGELSKSARPDCSNENSGNLGKQRQGAGTGEMSNSLWKTLLPGHQIDLTPIDS
jgi:hypothetical protein